MKNACINELFKLAMLHSEVIILCADGLGGLFQKLATERPTQYVDYGIAEQCMIASAAGIAHAGHIPFIFGTSNFISMRGYEFIRNDICIPNNNVKIIGMLSGLSRPTWGATHHGTEDIGLLRTMPELLIITPSSPNEARSAIDYAYKHKGPVYVRIEASGEYEFFARNHNFIPGKSIRIREGKDIAIFSMGSIAKEAIDAAEKMELYGISVRVVLMSTISPIDEHELSMAITDCQGIISLEEHSVWGGLGTAIAEYLAANKSGISFRKLGLRGCVKVCGDRKYLRDYLGIGESGVMKAIKEIMEQS